MTDRELLEAAAEAAGIAIEWDGDLPIPFGSAIAWNPLTDDGDALRLAVKLGIDLQFANRATWIARETGPRAVRLDHEPHRDDPCAATRRAIVRAAAAIAG